jgi:enediyne polyketide synthase
MASGQEVRGAVQVLAARQPGSAAWNVTAVDAAGQAILTWTGLRLRAIGPLTHASTWHPSLLAVSLEGRAAELGLDPALQVTIRGAQPAAHRAGLTADPAVGSARAGFPDGPRAPWLDAAVGSGPLGGFDLIVRAAHPVACQWTTTGPRPDGDEPRMTWPADPDGRAESDLARLGEQVAALSRESRTSVTARLAVVAACLAAAGWQPRTPLLLDDACAGTWLRVRAGHVTVACTIASMSGVAGLIAIALATWPIAARVGPPAAAGHDPAMAAGGGGVCDMPVAANGSGPDAATRSLTLRATRTAGGKSRS